MIKILPRKKTNKKIKIKYLQKNPNQKIYQNLKKKRKDKQINNYL